MGEGTNGSATQRYADPNPYRNGSGSGSGWTTRRLTPLGTAFAVILLAQAAAFPTAFYVGTVYGFFTYTREWGIFYGCAVLAPLLMTLGFITRDGINGIVEIMRLAVELRSLPKPPHST